MFRTTAFRPPFHYLRGRRPDAELGRLLRRTIRFRMDQQGLTNKDLVPLLGSRSRVSEVLSGRRTLSLKMIRALAGGLRIPADVLLSR